MSETRINHYRDWTTTHNLSEYQYELVNERANTAEKNPN